MGINRYYYTTQINNKKEHFSKNAQCIFISYQSADRDAAKKIADYVLTAGLDVYFDQYDGDLRISNQSINPKKLVDSLCKGINNSSHMMVVVSNTTMQSRWVPFEIGFGYEKTSVYCLCLRGIPKGGLPEYLQTTKIIRDIYDLNSTINTLTDKSSILLKSSNQTSDQTSTSLLSSIMDTLIIDNY
jgi:hypothetical protein